MASSNTKFAESRALLSDEHRRNGKEIRSDSSRLVNWLRKRDLKLDVKWEVKRIQESRYRCAQKKTCNKHALFSSYLREASLEQKRKGNLEIFAKQEPRRPWRNNHLLVHPVVWLWAGLFLLSIRKFRVD